MIPNTFNPLGNDLSRLCPTTVLKRRQADFIINKNAPEFRGVIFFCLNR